MSTTNNNKEEIKRQKQKTMLEMQAAPWVVQCPEVMNMPPYAGLSRLCRGLGCPRFVQRHQATNGSIAGVCTYSLYPNMKEQAQVIIFDVDIGAYVFMKPQLTATVKPPPSKPQEFRDVFTQS